MKHFYTIEFFSPYILASLNCDDESGPGQNCITQHKLAVHTL